MARNGDNLPDGGKFRLFPGLLPILLSLAALVLRPMKSENSNLKSEISNLRWVKRLDAFVVVAFAVSILTIGFDNSDAFGGFFNWIRSGTRAGCPNRCGYCTTTVSPIQRFYGAARTQI